MAHNTTVFRQLLDLLPRHEFDAEARQHQEGQRLRVMSRWAQFVALGLGQLGGLQSLRDIVGNLRACRQFFRGPCASSSGRDRAGRPGRGGSGKWSSHTLPGGSGGCPGRETRAFAVPP